jgi:hypothetical protein
MEALKHAPSWNLRHRRDSISGLSTHSQPMNYALGGQCHSPAPTYHSQGIFFVFFLVSFSFSALSLFALKF